MSLQANPANNTEPEVWSTPIRLVGTGAANPTKQAGGNNLTVTRTGVGVFRLQWADPPGTFVRALYALGSTTMSATKQCTVTFGAYDATNRRLDLSLWDAAGAARELAAAEFLHLDVQFKQTSV